MEPTENTSTEGKRSEILLVSDFEGLKLPEVLPPYAGEGKTSFKAEDKGINYDAQKEEYLESLGLEIPNDWIAEDGEIKKDSRALFITTFILTGHILVCEEMRRSMMKDPNFNEDVFADILRDRDSQIREHRLDNSGMRRVLPDGSRVESYYEKMNLSANPEKRVTEEELVGLVSYIFAQLKK